MRSPAALAAVVLLAACSSDTLVSSDIAVPELPRDIRYGALDGDAHPHVGLMVAQTADGVPLWRCSGTLISPTVFLTAGHCTYGAGHVEIWFDADLRAEPSYPYTGDVGGTPHTPSEYDPGAFFLHDVGVVVLDEPVIMSSYASLPDEDALETLATARGLQERSFTAVGYGLQWSSPVPERVESQRLRMSATPHLVAINTGVTGSYSLLLSNNANTGGTCFGDSGGPNFLGSSNVVAGVTSFGLNGNCAGSGGVFRMDRAEVRQWVLDFLD